MLITSNFKRIFCIAFDSFVVLGSLLCFQMVLNYYGLLVPQLLILLSLCIGTGLTFLYYDV